MQTIENKRLIIKEDEEGKTYSLKAIHTKYQSKKSIVAMLQDETAYEKIMELEDKYRKMHTASIVHDIRTPLNGLMGMMDVIEALDTKGEFKAYLEVAKSTSRLLSFLTYDITDYSQLEEKKLNLNNNSQEIRELIKETLQIMSFQYEKKKIGLFCKIEQTVPEKVNIDKNRYMQILLNFLGNALKFTFNGEVKVKVNYTENNDLITTSVQDTGIGIKQEDVPKLFQAFGKIDGESGKLNPNGTGFGLHICRRLSEVMGGFAGVESTFGQGSKFTFAIKANIDVETGLNEKSSLMKNASVQLPRRNTIKLVPLRKRTCKCPRILHVDDTESNLYVLQAYMKIMGEEADEASNGMQALEIIKSRLNNDCCQTYDLILMDINMPIMDGIETVQEIKRIIEEGIIQDVPVVAITASILKPEEEQYYQSIGFSGSVSKPISRKDYTATLSKYIHGP